MSYTYVVLGAGRQGTAAAYDLACWGDAGRILLADVDLNSARRSAERVSTLVGSKLVEAQQVDVTNQTALAQVLSGADAVLSAVPYYYNLEITRAALGAGAHLNDLGGNTDIVRQQHSFDDQARSAGISIIPDCGQVPGMGATLMVYAMGLLDQVTDVYMWDGGLPQQPRPPFYYLLTFNIAGLTNEYAEPAIFLRNGVITTVEPMTELESVDFPPVGRLEAFVAGGGTSTMPWTYQGKLRTLQNLTLRYPGHHAQLRAFWDLGLWSLEPIQVGEQTIIPRDVFHALYLSKVTYPLDRDVVLIRVKAVGQKDGKPAQALVELVDYYDEKTGFKAMERSTGWSAAIVTAMMARGQTPRGAGGVESFVPAQPFVSELQRRGFQVSERIQQE
jgi:lysine 6-dehydrogenase